jgi:hypothetical protein
MRIMPLFFAASLLACNTPATSQTEAIQDNCETAPTPLSTAEITSTPKITLTTLEYEDQPVQAEPTKAEAVNEEALKGNVQALNDKAEVKVAIDKDVIRRVIRRGMPNIKFCYEEALKNSPTLTGKVVVDFTIASDGKVTTSQITSGIQPEMDGCVAQSIAQLYFPAFESGTTMKIVYPFTFEPS